VRESVYEYSLDLSLLVPSLTPTTVWDLPLWAWRGYVQVVKAHRDEMRKQREGR
jgi:hypothetical protein